MTIGIEATKAFEREKTGIGWYTYYVIRELVRLIGQEDELRVYINPTRISNFKFLISNKIPNSKFQIQKLRWPLRKFWTQLRLSWEMWTNPPDVLFIPSHLPPLKHPKKLIVTIHDLAFKKYPEVYSRKELWLQEWGLKRVLNRAWRIIVPSKFTKSEIYKYYPRLVRDNIYVVAHGVFQSQNSNVKCQNYNSNVKTKYILYVGRVEAKKNIQNLIKAFNIIKNNIPRQLAGGQAISQYPNIQLLLIGNRGYGYHNIKQEIDASPYKSDIKELGWLDRNAISDHLCRATVFVFPSLYEGFGLPLLEAMACNAPVACSDIPPLREAGADAPVYFNPIDPNDIAEKIIKLIKNDNLRQQKIQTGLKRAKQFTWNKAAQKTWEIIKNKKAPILC